MKEKSYKNKDGKDIKSYIIEKDDNCFNHILQGITALLALSISINVYSVVYGDNRPKSSIEDSNREKLDKRYKYLFKSVNNKNSLDQILTGHPWSKLRISFGTDLFRKLYIENEIDEFVIDQLKVDDNEPFGDFQKEIIKINKGNIFFNTTFYPFSVFYEENFTSNLNFNNDSWYLAKAIRNIISHGKIIDYKPKPAGYLKRKKDNKYIFKIGNFFEFTFTPDMQGKYIYEFISPVELICLMIQMNKDIS